LYHFFIKRVIVAVLFLIPLISMSQTDVLLLKKNGRNIKTYATGQTIIVQTIYDQWLGGTITDLRNDSVFINGIPFHVHEIQSVRQEFTKWNYNADGTILIIAGAGLIALNVINGIYTGESAGSWVKTSAWITAGTFILGGILLKRARYKNYPLGKKYTLSYINMKVNSYHQPVDTNHNDPLEQTEPAKQSNAH
jgi:hypothetical protein